MQVWQMPISYHPIIWHHCHYDGGVQRPLVLVCCGVHDAVVLVHGVVPVLMHDVLSFEPCGCYGGIVVHAIPVLQMPRWIKTPHR